MVARWDQGYWAAPYPYARGGRVRSKRCNDAWLPQDIHAYDPSSLAVLTSDTLEHDISAIPGGRIAIHNSCTDTTRHMNGIVTNMNPSEGVWLFR